MISFSMQTWYKFHLYLIQRSTCLFVLLIYVPVNSYGHYGMVSSPNTYLPCMMASRMTMTKKKNVMSNRIRKFSYLSPSAGSISSPEIYMYTCTFTLIMLDTLNYYTPPQFISNMQDFSFKHVFMFILENSVDADQLISESLKPADQHPHYFQSRKYQGAAR